MPQVASCGEEGLKPFRRERSTEGIHASRTPYQVRRTSGIDEVPRGSVEGVGIWYRVLRTSIGHHCFVRDGGCQCQVHRNHAFLSESVIR